MRITIFLLLLIGYLPARSQQGVKRQTLDAMQKLAERYRSNEGIGFDIQYRYSMEQTPGLYLDSLKGECKMSGNQYWYQMDNTESIRTNDFVIMLFREDSLMYLNKPNDVAEMVNPVAMMDSLLNHSGNIDCRITEHPGYTSLFMDFKVRSAYKSLEYQVDRQSGLLLKIVSVVRAEQLGYETPAYAIVETSFTNYRQGGIDHKLFKAENYFRKEGNEYVTVAPYSSYRIFLGSTGM